MSEIEFSHDKIRKIADRIGNMRDKKWKKDLINIKDIIVSNNPDIAMIKNNNGYFAPEFEKLSQKTFYSLQEYFNKIENREKRCCINFGSDTESNTDNYYQEKTDDVIDNNKKLKYTNSENHILNRLKYDKALKQHQSECEELTKDENIMMHDSKKDKEKKRKKVKNQEI